RNSHLAIWEACIQGNADLISNESVAANQGMDVTGRLRVGRVLAKDENTEADGGHGRVLAQIVARYNDIEPVTVLGNSISGAAEEQADIPFVNGSIAGELD